MNFKSSALAVTLAVALIAVVVTFWHARRPPILNAPVTTAVPAPTSASAPAPKLTPPKKKKAAAAPAGVPVVVDVGTDFYSTDDYFAFIERTAKRALTDPRAAYYVGWAGRQCYVAVRLYQSVDSPLFDRQLARCERFLNDPSTDPYAGLPARDGGYPWKFWRDRAVAGGDYLAVLESLLDNRDRLADDVRHERVREALDAAVLSGDPDVYWQVGATLMHPDVVLDSSPGFAWLLVACEYGFDCRMGNRAIGIGCEYIHPDYPCNPDEPLVDNLRGSYGAEYLDDVQRQADGIIADLDAGRVPDVDVNTPGWLRERWAEFQAARERGEIGED